MSAHVFVLDFRFRRYRPGRLPWRPVRPNLSYLHTWEERIIVRDIILAVGHAERISAADLVNRYPGRYSEKRLVTALRRMARTGVVSKGKRMGNGKMGYSIPLL